MLPIETVARVLVRAMDLDPGIRYMFALDAAGQPVIYAVGEGWQQSVVLDQEDDHALAADPDGVAALVVERLTEERRARVRELDAATGAYVLAKRKPVHLADRALTWSPLNRVSSVEHDPKYGRRVIARASSPLRQKVLIVGGSMGSDDSARYLDILGDPSWDVWALNLIPPTDRHGRVRADVWWDIHQRKAQTADDLRWIANCPRPIYVPDDLVDAGPTCVPFPIGTLRCWAPNGAPFACTFAYQIAFACLSAYKLIALYGVELSLGTRREQTVEWASVNWWLGYARARGVEIEVPADSRLGQHRHLYGFEYDEEIADVDAYLLKVEPYQRAQLDELDTKRRRGESATTSMASVGG